MWFEDGGKRNIRKNVKDLKHMTIVNHNLYCWNIRKVVFIYFTFGK